MSLTRRKADAVVVGAGLAGLVAARELRDAGLDTVVVEAGTRVGGRVRTSNFAAAGRDVDLGAEWIAPAHHLAVMAEMTRYGIAPLPADHDDVSVVDDQPLTVEDRAEFERVLRRCDHDARRIDFFRPDWYRGVDDLDVPMAVYVDSLTTNTAVRDVLLANAFALVGADEHRYSALNLLHEFAGFGSAADAFFGETCRVAGGASSLPNAIADELGDSIMFEWRVVRIETTSSGIGVAGPRGRIDTAGAVIALPVIVLAGMDLAIPLPDEARRVLTEGHVGRAAKGWATVSGVDAGFHSTGWPDAPEAYALPGDHAIAMGTFGLADPDSETALRRSWAALAARHPGLVFDGDEITHDWVSDPLSSGTWHSVAPGQAAGWHALANVAGPCVFAGGDLSRRWSGWMDGAITSGADAASRLGFVLAGRGAPSAEA